MWEPRAGWSRPAPVQQHEGRPLPRLEVVDVDAVRADEAAAVRRHCGFLAWWNVYGKRRSPGCAAHRVFARCSCRRYGCGSAISAVLHREQAELGAVRHAGLGVDVLDMAAGRLGRDHQLPGDGLGGQAARRAAAAISTSRAVRPAGHSRRRRTRCPAARSTASAASPSRRPALTSARSSAAASAADRAGRCGRGLGERVVDCRPRPESRPAGVIASPDRPRG